MAWRMRREWKSVAWVCLYTCLIASCRHTAASIICACTTSDCQRSSERSCEAENMCYVQYLPLAPDNDPHMPAVVRGCIDDRTPLLCENRRPKTYRGSWPVLLCCKNDDWCNRDVMPTNPPWVNNLLSQPTPHYDSDDEDGDLPGVMYYEDDDDDDYPSPRHKVPDEDDAPSESRPAVNPLYVGVPVAGACVLLAIIIFAIYILKRHNEYIEEYNARTASCKQQMYAPHPLRLGKPLPAPCTRNCLYPESDQSSNASESRLLPVLLKV